MAFTDEEEPLVGDAALQQIYTDASRIVSRVLVPCGVTCTETCSDSIFTVG